MLDAGKSLRSNLRSNIMMGFALVIMLWGASTIVISHYLLKETLIRQGLERAVVVGIGRNFMIVSSGFSIVVLSIAVFIAAFVSNSIARPIKKLAKEVAEIANGKLNTKIDAENQSELTELADSFRNITDQLKKSHAHLEETVRRRTAELSDANERLKTEIVEREKTEQMLEERTERVITFQKTLQNLGKIVCDDLDSTVKALIKEDAATLNVDRVSIWLFNTDQSELICHDLYGRVDNTHQSGTSLKTKDYPQYFKAIDDHRIIAAHDARNDPHTAGLTEAYLIPSGITSMMSVPLRVHGKAIGTLCHEHTGQIRHWSPEEQVFAASVAGLVLLHLESEERRHAEHELEELNKHLTTALHRLNHSNQELQDFAYIISHDLKAPLRGIKTVAEWISTDYADKLDDSGKEQLDLLAGRVNRMHDLIEGVLQYSRVGRTEENRSRVSLNEIIHDCIDAIALPENIEIIVEDDLPAIECEKIRITQVFQNLLDNAVKYMDKPQGRVRIGCTEEDGCYKFSVSDNGPGIDRKHFEKIFKIFQTLSVRDENESTGVGLTLVKKIVELYEGEIWLESELGSGSTFFFSLPKEQVQLKGEQLQANVTG